MDFETCVSPELYSVQVGQYAEQYPAEELEWEDLSSAVADVEGHPGSDAMTGRYCIVLDATSEALADLKPWRRARTTPRCRCRGRRAGCRRPLAAGRSGNTRGGERRCRTKPCFVLLKHDTLLGAN